MLSPRRYRFCLSAGAFCRCIDIQDSNKTEKTQALRLVRKVRVPPQILPSFTRVQVSSFESVHFFTTFSLCNNRTNVIVKVKVIDITNTVVAPLSPHTHTHTHTDDGGERVGLPLLHHQLPDGPGQRGLPGRRRLGPPLHRRHL